MMFLLMLNKLQKEHKPYAPFDAGADVGTEAPAEASADAYINGLMLVLRMLRLQILMLMLLTSFRSHLQLKYVN